MLFLLYFLGFFAYGAFDSLESLFYRDVLLVSGEWMGWLSACAGVSATAKSRCWFGTNKAAHAGDAFRPAAGDRCGLHDLRWHGERGRCRGGPARDRPWLWRHAAREGHDPATQLRRLVRGARDICHERGHQQRRDPALLVAPLVANVLGVQGTLFAASAVVAAIAVSALAYCTRRS